MTAIPDLSELGKRWGWKLESGEHLASIRDALARGQPVAVLQEAGRRDWWESFFGEWPHSLERIDAWPRTANHRGCLLITDRTRPLLTGTPHAVFRPPSLAVGVSCSTEIAPADLDDALHELFDRHQLSQSSLMALATVAGEPSQGTLAQVADDRGLPLLSYLRDKVTLMRPFLGHTEALGVSGPAALLAAGAKELLVAATLIGDVKLAVARRERA